MVITLWEHQKQYNQFFQKEMKNIYQMFYY